MVSCGHFEFILFHSNNYSFHFFFIENYLRIGVFRCLSSVFNSELPDYENKLLLEKKIEIVNLCLYLFKVSVQI